MEFKQFADKVNEKFVELSTNSEYLYKVNISSDLLWEKYLGSYKGEDAKIFRERPIHDCNTCKSFIKRLGNVVSIKDNILDSIWNVKGLEAPYKEVAETLHNLVVKSDISSFFYTTESLAGREYNIEKNVAGDIKWEHFYADISSRFVVPNKDEIRAELESTVSVFNRALSEFDLSTLDTVLDLCSSIYRGEEFSPMVRKFKEALERFKTLNDIEKKYFIWTEFNKYPSKIRNTAIGTLVVDIQKGMDLEDAVKSFESKVAPQNYKRTSAVITPAMVKSAMNTINELGIEASLHRRFAQLEDVSINDVLYANRNSRQLMKDSKGIENILMESTTKKDKSLNPEDINVEDFISNILPIASKIEVLPEAKHFNNLCSIIAPVNSEAPNILKWDNNFSWAYKGGFTDAIKENVKSAGGNVEGVLRFSIQWNDNRDNENDLDAHCNSDYSHIYYGDKKGKCGGELDIDIINPQGKVAVENIIWTKNPPKGKYEMKVVNFSDRGGSNFKAQIEFGGQIFDYEVKGRINKNYKIATITSDGQGNFSIEHHIPYGESKKTIDGVTTQEYNIVSAIMLSPNYWGNNKVGNKHYMFLLEGARNDESIRGLYNEFLSDSLMVHRKVFETLGSKLLCENVEKQLSGLGFSSTVRNELIAKVSLDKATKLYKIKF